MSIKFPATNGIGASRVRSLLTPQALRGRTGGAGLPAPVAPVRRPLKPNCRRASSYSPTSVVWKHRRVVAVQRHLDASVVKTPQRVLRQRRHHPRWPRCSKRTTSRRNPPLSQVPYQQRIFYRPDAMPDPLRPRTPVPPTPTPDPRFPPHAAPGATRAPAHRRTHLETAPPDRPPHPLPPQIQPPPCGATSPPLRPSRARDPGQTAARRQR